MPEANVPSVFLDSNVIFSGLHSPNGRPAQILHLCASGRLRLLLSQLVIDEVAANVQAKLKSEMDNLLVFLVECQPIVIADPDPRAVEAMHTIDTADAAVLAAAIDADADYFVTGDKRLLANARALGFSSPKLVSPAELLDDLTSR